MAFEPYRTPESVAKTDADMLAKIGATETTNKLQQGVKNMRTAVRRKYLESLYPRLVFQPYPKIEDVGAKSVRITSADGKRWVEICCDLYYNGVNGYQYNAKSSDGDTWGAYYGGSRCFLPGDGKRSLGAIFEQIEKVIFEVSTCC